MADATPEAVLAEFVRIVGGIDGLNPGQYPSEQDHNRIVCFVYPGQGRSQISTSSGGHAGLPMRWTFETIMIDVGTLRSDMEYDFAAIVPYAFRVEAALFKEWSHTRFSGLATTLGDATTPGSTWPVRRSLIFPQQAGINVIGYRFEVDVSYEVVIA